MIKHQVELDFGRLDKNLQVDAEPTHIQGISFDVGDRSYRIFGGPIKKAPTGIPTICVANEYVSDKYDVNVATPDFGVPTETELRVSLLRAFRLLCNHGDIYVGCRGGIGRTGTFMASMLKVLGGDDDDDTYVSQIRASYLSSAVETQEQVNLVNTLVVSDIHPVVNMMFSGE